MKRKTRDLKTGYEVVSLAAAFITLPMAVQAYVGPGAGLTAIGTMIALLAAILLALVGFIWYPLKRMMRARKAKADIQQTARETES